MSKEEAISQPLRDLDQVRQFKSGQGPVAICDMPWLPVYLAILFLFHAYLGWLAVAGAVILIALTLVSEVTLRQPMQRLAQLGGSRAEFIEAGRRNAEALQAMGMSGAYFAFERRPCRGDSRFRLVLAIPVEILDRGANRKGEFSRVFRSHPQGRMVCLGTPTRSRSPLLAIEI
ncbi:hypothetical protein [Ensifer sp. BR816]|uniref:hypothetical protein n=1 Tax=Rhizobium sp. (strain BR816) TaxID=1057002 RepID=UPI0003799064|nr:hypothetical protein [Ensifer sp. BR816]